MTPMAKDNFELIVLLKNSADFYWLDVSARTSNLILKLSPRRTLERILASVPPPTGVNKLGIKTTGL
jgi:hypothetical protein